jgi:two-component system, OmpR family, sensor histidine kinase BaeS
MKWRTTALGLAVVVLGSIVLAEWMLAPITDADRVRFLFILGGPALVAFALVPLLRRLVNRRASVIGTAILMGSSALTIGAVTSSAASNAMFLSDHDYRLFLVMIVLSSGITVVVGASLASPLARDIRALGAVADRVSGGDLTVRSGLRRADELGRSAAALDAMVLSLHDAATARDRQRLDQQQMLASLGHDLRTPLSAVRAAVEGLQDRIDDQPDRLLGVIAHQVDVVDSLLDRLVEWARLGSGATTLAALERISVAELVDECIESMRPLATQHGVRMECSTTGPAVADIDPIAVARVIRNLVDNAVEHSPDGGTVACAVAEYDSWVEVAITDDGPGFSDDLSATAFDPFVRGDDARSPGRAHAGLGLSICQAIVNAHGGTISIRRPARGAQIMVRLPVKGAGR